MGFDVADSTFIDIVRNNTSIRGILRGLGFRAPHGSAHAKVHAEVARLGLDTAHWTGCAHGTSKRAEARPLESLLVQDSEYPRGALKARLLGAGILEERCAKCRMGPEWQGERLVLQLDHTNGVRNDHSRGNLRLLCPNCHSQTPTFAGRSLRKERTCLDCAVPIKARGIRCRSCAAKALGRHKIVWPPKEDLRKWIAESSVLAVARRLGVSDNGIRKHLNSGS